MTSTLLLPTLLLVLAADTDRPRKPSIIAPSLPALTREEEQKLDDIVNSFILADTGRLRGVAKTKAVKDFEALKMEAVPALIRGLNKAAKYNHTCPVLMIRKKLERLLLSSNDQQLLEFARDEIGAEVGKSRYSGTLQDLRVKIALRKTALARLTPVTVKPKGPSAMTTTNLVKAASTVRGAQLRPIVAELAKREGKEVIGGLTTVAASYDKDMQKLGREALDTYLTRHSMSQMRERFTDSSAEVRRAAIRVAGSKHLDLVPWIIDAVTDKDAAVRAEARSALKKLAKDKEDFGPTDSATVAAQREAQQKWRAWWKKK